MHRTVIAQVIKQISFKHGWYYHYRVHKPKLDSLCSGMPSLRNYILSMFNSCPHELFCTGPRGSKLKFNVNLDIKSVKNHEVCKLTEMGLKANKSRFRSAHSKVQVFMLENDSSTLAVEVPIWSHTHELRSLCPWWKNTGPLTGHIDLLRVEDGKIWVWDYKPNAVKEKYASTQVYFYAVMLSLRTGIPLNMLRCGYFDHSDAFIFKPAATSIEDSILDAKEQKITSDKVYAMQRAAAQSRIINN